MELLESYNSLKWKKNFFIGFYWWWNYWDELLMEVLMNYNELNKIDWKFLFLNRVNYKDFHRIFSYSKIVFNYTDFIISTIKSDNVIFWWWWIFSEDSSFKHLLILIYVSMLKIFWKNIYFYGIWFYKNAKNKFISKILIKFTSKLIFVRDNSSFKTLWKSKILFKSKDLSFILKDYDFSNLYSKDLFKISWKNYILFSIRKSILDKNDNFLTQILLYIKNNPEKEFIFWDMWVWKDYSLIKNISNVKILKNTNPLEIFYFLKRNKKHFKIITPQFHWVITAKLLDIPFLPLYYADKWKDIIKEFWLTPISVIEVNQSHFNNFINK